MAFQFADEDVVQQGGGRHGEGRQERSLHNLQEGRILLRSGGGLSAYIISSSSVQDEEDFKTRVLASQVYKQCYVLSPFSEK